MNHSATPWKVDHEPWMEFYLIKDANGIPVAQVSSYKNTRKPGSWQMEPDFDLAHANAHRICQSINERNADEKNS